MNRNTHKNVTVHLRIQQHHQGILSYLESTTYKNSQISGITTHEIEIQVLTCVSKLVVEGRIVVQCEKRVATLSPSKALSSASIKTSREACLRAILWNSKSPVNNSHTKIWLCLVSKVTQVMLKDFRLSVKSRPEAFTQNAGEDNFYYLQPGWLIIVKKRHYMWLKHDKNIINAYWLDRWRISHRWK